jgi:hypothetical protein
VIFSGAALAARNCIFSRSGRTAAATDQPENLYQPAAPQSGMLRMPGRSGLREK